ncbi:DoxX family protein [Halogranum rubrum]|uniref:DoxX family protein n=1 Tax=Halogranum salarium B-1 TaxID=1210908 RepID=J3JHC4_9EURY|nr:DoxX family protein [Halogranum salarium]EJN60869.1 DoxX family protein [Halogranum salarium B-1]
MSEEAITIDIEDEQASEAAAEESSDGLLFLLARLLFAIPLGFTALNHWKDMEGTIGYAEAMGVPNADKLVPFSVGMLSFGSIGIALWRLPTLAAGAVATFLVGVTPQMHRFWEADEEQKQSEQTHFVKNVAMLGGALAFLIKARQD